MSLFEIKNRFSGRVIFSLECGSLKLCVESAVKSGADLSGADLSGSDLSRAKLSGSDLSGSDLSRADLSGADLSGSDLSGAYLSRAYLSGSDLSRAKLPRAYLSGAKLSRADLSGAVLSGSDLSGADLSRAKLSGANYGEGMLIESTPLQLLGTKYTVIVMDTHIKIGCKLYSHTQWESFTNAEISSFDSGALEWWSEWKGFVLRISLGHQQRIAAKRVK